MNATFAVNTSDLRAAYDAALAESKIDADSVCWTSPWAIRVTISGRSIPARVKVATAAGLRAALADALNLYCAVRATETVSGAAANWAALKA